MCAPFDRLRVGRGRARRSLVASEFATSTRPRSILYPRPPCGKRGPEIGCARRLVEPASPGCGVLVDVPSSLAPRYSRSDRGGKASTLPAASALRREDIRVAKSRALCRDRDRVRSLRENGLRAAPALVVAVHSRSCCTWHLGPPPEVRQRGNRPAEARDIHAARPVVGTTGINRPSSRSAAPRYRTKANSGSVPRASHGPDRRPPKARFPPPRDGALTGQSPGTVGTAVSGGGPPAPSARSAL
jgi:hypothetical protein